MSHVLNLADTVLLQARRLSQTGQNAQAMEKLTNLLTHADLPSEVTAEAHTQLGELYIKRRRFRKARKHLRTALEMAPENARLHQRLGQCHANDPEGKPELALRHFRKALKLDPDRARWRAEAGLLTLRQGRVDDGLSMLRQAAQHSPEDPVILSRLVKGLTLAGQPDEALRLVRLARFAEPRCERTQKLEADLLLGRMRRDQECDTATKCANTEPVLLPFVRRDLPATNDNVRRDRPHALAGPHLVKLPVRASKRMS